MKFQNVRDIFERISEISTQKVQNYSDMIHDAMYFIKKKLKEDLANEYDIKRCEYASACVAYYDYTVLSLMKDTNVITLSGTTSEGLKRDEKYICAKKLRDNAIANITDLVIDVDFIFTSM